ncbi:hypothetical protein QBC34DRAFT_488850 [Podospora aff. communis PSN243]|uniref:LysM domain-containing protein n=1 Tax=Podospora aff. communis PSN243 TaxID=3040156 RepID=A0AAV9G502_9PEZI|nr:hypothetical protein QBC34DRAFT_488850 [Podospora aff. communis PSN243]
MVSTTLLRGLVALALSSGVQSQVSVSQCTQTITARAGDTCASLAELAGISVTQFLRCPGFQHTIFDSSRPSAHGTAQMVTTTSLAYGSTTSTVIQSTTATATATQTVRATVVVTSTVLLTSTVTTNSTLTETVRVTATATSTQTQSTTETSIQGPGATPIRPTPVLPGAPSNCKAYDRILESDTCRTLANRNDLLLRDFYQLNPSVSSSIPSSLLCTPDSVSGLLSGLCQINCESLWTGYYVCTAT